MTTHDTQATAAVAVRHSFETAHRLPQLGGKCVNLHGHSWQVEIQAGAAALPPSGVLLDFGTLKAQLRGWVDEHLDHGAMLSIDDPLLPALEQAGCKVYRFGAGDAMDLRWPTVENVAVLLARITSRLMNDPAGENTDPPRLQRVTVTETATNQAVWTAP